MALKGSFGFFNGELPKADAYAVVDAINISKGGSASCHVSIYARTPLVEKIAVPQLNEATKIMETVQVDQVDRGPVIEHFTCAGVDTTGKDAFVAAYEQLASLDDRFKEMVADV
jgi:hypothetical protein